MSDYNNQSWVKIYDDMFNSSNWYNDQKQFYLDELSEVKNKILEVACGTGLITLELLGKGLDVYGFDLSPPMLDLLHRKAGDRNIDVSNRIKTMNMINFGYDISFDYIILPSRSFLHITDQKDQIKCLRNIWDHLAPQGKFIINFFNPLLKFLVKYSEQTEDFEKTGRFNGIDGNTYDLLFTRLNDFTNQVQSITWRFVNNSTNESVDEHMKVRWIYKEEFKLLLHAAGFSKWTVFGDFDRSELITSSPEQVWIVEK